MTLCKIYMSAHIASITGVLLHNSTLDVRGGMLKTMAGLQCILRCNDMSMLAAQDQGSNQGQQAPEDMQDVDQPARWSPAVAEPAHNDQQQMPKRPAGACASIAQRSAPEDAPEMVRACHHTIAMLQR